MLSSSSSSSSAPTRTPASHKNTLNLNNTTLSSSSSSSSFSTEAPPPPSNSTTKTMEEVWNDINLASLNDHSTRPMSSTTFGGIMFQDFLARPFTINDPSQNTTNISCSSPSPSPAPHPLTALSLGASRPDNYLHFDHHYRYHHHHHHHHRRNNALGHVHHLPQHVHHHQPKGVSCNFNGTALSSSPSSSPFEALACSSSLPCFGSKRFAEPADSAATGDRRNKRMIKNRESAARSRARKQAYTNELQLKVDHLLEENARLKKQQQQLCEAAASQQKKKSSLYRTSTAPF